MLRYIAMALMLSAVSGLTSELLKAEQPKTVGQTTIQLFNSEIFGKSTKEAVVLLKPKAKRALAPETVMVDVNDDVYFAATVRYPKSVTLQQVRKCVNDLYKKWEKDFFANDPEMGIWRIEDESTSIQLTEDENNIVLIYIKYSLVTEEMVERSLSRAVRELEKERTKK